MELDLDETYFRAAHPMREHDQRLLHAWLTFDDRRQGIYVSRAPVPSCYVRRPTEHLLRLTGFMYQPGDPEYEAAAKATRTKGNEPVYWFKEYRCANSFCDGDFGDNVHEIHTASQVDSDASL